MMRRALLQQALVGITTIGAFALLQGCKAPAAAGDSSMNTASNDVSATRTVAGTLGLKGSDLNAWWALEDDQGRVWRLVTKSDEQRKQFDTMQHKRIEVTGKPLGKLLANEQLQVEKAALAP
jgi:hypothetical protein